ncbi:olfactory receptor 2A14-like [Betta splendens]|uniref:Olfactory receptor 2A14-like n=1 Tax=Betta splendens TaxID=158456 RepID=A0A6P7P7Z6_BETSP|nr:olfactory receptor 2A14-like [Betta splendens]
MVNSSQVSHFTLSAYVDTGLFRYFLFTAIMSFYALIVGANVLLIVVICINRRLHEPMYLFLCSLFANELQGSAGFFPFFLTQILSDVHTVSTLCCFLQIFLLFSYINVQLCSLSVMSYDRYLAVCHPLHYGARMTAGTAAALIALTWIYAFTEVAVMMSLSARLQLCGSVINKVYCDHYSVVKLSCSDSSASNIRGLVYIVCVVAGVVSLICFSYFRILRVCFCGSAETRHKAVTTCTPHLASLLNFSCGCVFELIQSRFNMSNVPDSFRVFLSLYFLTCQPLFNPLLYGLKMSKIRSSCKSLISGKM